MNETLDTGQYDWALWMDFDTLFTNLSTTMEEFMEDAKENHRETGQKWEDVDMIAAPDWYFTTLKTYV